MAVSAAAHPARPHDDNQHIAVLNACPNVFAKIQSWRDAVDVAKHSLATITAGEPVEDAAGDVHRIVTTIGNRDLGHVNNALRRQDRRKGGCGKARRAEDSLGAHHACDSAASADKLIDMDCQRSLPHSAVASVPY